MSFFSQKKKSVIVVLYGTCASLCYSASVLAFYKILIDLDHNLSPFRHLPKHENKIDDVNYITNPGIVLNLGIAKSFMSQAD